MHNSDLTKRIMRRVYAIWLFKKLTSPLGIEFLALAAIFSVALSHISFFNVTRNAFASSSFSSLARFLINNFILADLISQLLAVGMILMILILGWELFKKKESHILEPTS